MIVLDVVGLRPEHVRTEKTPNLAGLLDSVAPLRPPFPAVTVPVQTTLAEGCGPREHGDVANGQYDRERDEVAFWERDRGDRNRLWETAQDAGLTTGALFFQHLIGTTADVAVTPSPIEDEDDNLVEMNCWTNPDDFYGDLQEEYGHFPLHNYWGPMANEESSEWILNAAIEAVERYDPDMLWVYVPHLDYAGLRNGPGDELESELAVVDELVGEFLDALRTDNRWEETVVNVVSEYGFHAVETPVFPNRALRSAGLLSVTDDGSGGQEVDLARSRAFAMVDHQIAHVYVDDAHVEKARSALAELDGVERVLGADGKREHHIDHPNAGDVVLVAERDAWFQYYWWHDRDEAPRYATEMDIHAKPGFDPCELFVGETGLASLDPTKVGGSHGRVDPSAGGLYALGGPSAPELVLNDEVDARAVAPTVADLLGTLDEVEMAFEEPSLLTDG
ncbi:alkaline phosphatase family protein [Halopelagius longus]|uniref:Alkaline phosphatase family protein n=1 Tax=Halopelagius longus TaxID=1236180 RepID=A0A370IFL1_9EURY|nr:alkaline phosphatase family protein [Halopelagius longus]